MKTKLTLLIALLSFYCSGAWADGLKVSTTESASAEYQYKIFCRGASDYYLGNTTNATSASDYGLFAFFAADASYANGYYIYSIFEGKWLSYEAKDSYTTGDRGTNKITLTTEKPSVPWYIAADETYNKYYDIRAFQTDKSVDASGYASWNWNGGAASNSSNTMGYYDYNNGNSAWGIVLAGGSGSPVADRKVVALYNRVTNGDEYPVKKNASVLVSNSTSDDAQLFVLRQNGIDTNGEAMYNIQKAEGNGDYLYTTSPSSNSYVTTPANYIFLNKSCQFVSDYPKKSDSEDFATSPYYNFLAKNDYYRSLHSKCNNGGLNGWSADSNNSNAIYVQYKGTGDWNNLWTVKEQALTAWQVVITGAAGSVTYGGTALISGGTTTQSNNGIFVLNATPTAGDFTITPMDGCTIDPSLTIDSDRKIVKVVYTSYTATLSTITTALSNAPEGVGYPTTTARTRLQAAIDAFNASKTTANFTALNTQYDAFLTNVVLPEGKVFTIQSYIKSKTSHELAYLENIDGTLTISEAASATALNNLWVVRKSGNFYVLQSAADITKYIVYSSFTLNATGSEWTLSCGTEWPYISMYNSSLGGGRYVASNGSDRFGSAGEGGYQSDSKKQASGWSTDFKFVESDDYALYKVRIIYPSGSAPTVTYNATAYSNGSDFVAPTTLKASDLTVSEVTGYTPTVTIDGDIVYVNYDMEAAVPFADTWNYDSSPWLLLNDAPSAIDNAGRTYRYNTKRINISTTYTSSVEVVFAYTSGSYRIDVAGVDLIDPSTGDVVKGDYHDGYSGTYQSNREYAIRDVSPGNYILRYISYGQSTSSAGNISVRVVPGQGFFRLKNVATDKYLTATNISTWTSSTRYVYAIGEATDASTVIKLFDKDSNGSLYMYNQGYGFGWTATNHGGHVAWITSSPDKYVNWFPGSADDQVVFAICFGNGTGSYADYLEKGIYTADTSDEAVIAGNDKSADAAQWVIEAATSVTLSLNKVDSNTYGTTYLPFGVTLPSGGAAGNDVCAYTLTDNGNGWLTLNLLGEDGKSIPAGTPVLLKGTTSTSVIATIADVAALDPAPTNALSGTYLQMDHGDNLVLGKKDGVVGFYKYNFDIKANKAYIANASNVRGFILMDDDDATGIGSLTPTLSEDEGTVIYNMAGQRVSKAQKGIYIVNGKKILK